MITLLLQPHAKRADIKALRLRLREDARIAAVQFVPHDDALKDMSAVQGFAELITAFGRNPLPDAFLVTLKAGSGAGDIESLAADLGKLPGVAQVQVDAA